MRTFTASPNTRWPRRRERMSIWTVRSLCLAQPSGLASLDRRSPHECWVRLVSKSQRRPLWSSKPGRPRDRSPPLPNLGPKVKKTFTDPGPGEYCLLTQKAL